MILVSLSQIAFTSAIKFISFYQVISSENMREIFFKAAGLLFINDMPFHLGMFIRQFVLDTSEGDIKWLIYTMERP